ncbi:hypothetical protein BJ742DRAFT_873125 [Cladochytrium replicatum]|nr:hypothetical protein BJ742DRAFT_873125 [Cladochytrium replicatum]
MSLLPVFSVFRISYSYYADLPQHSSSRYLPGCCERPKELEEIVKVSPSLEIKPTTNFSKEDLETQELRSSKLQLLQAKGKRPTKRKKAEFFMIELNKHLDGIKKGKKKEEWESYLNEVVLSDEATYWDKNDVLVGLKVQKVVKDVEEDEDEEDKDDDGDEK